MNRFFHKDGLLVHTLRTHRHAFFNVLCFCACTFSLYLSFLVRFEFSQVGPEGKAWLGWFLGSAPLVFFVRTGIFMALGLQRVTWRYAGTRDAVRLWFAVLAGSAILAPTLSFLYHGFFPRSIFLLEGIIIYLVMGAARFSLRIAMDLKHGFLRKSGVRAIVIGAGAAGNLVIRAMLTDRVVDYTPVAILDDDPLKQGTTLQGIPVAGTIDDIDSVARQFRAEAIVLALPTASTGEFYRAIRKCKDTGLPLKTTPDMAQILKNSDVVTRVTHFRLEDLLDRRPIRSDVPEIQQFLYGRRVLVTGAAGSIGSELCRQIAEQSACRLICLDKDENGLFRLEHELRTISGSTELTFFLGDIKDRDRMDFLFGAEQPEVVFHAAAYKHVPILQHHPTEAVLNNVGGTRNMAELADLHGVGNFVLISTDKAVNPTSVMGATKRVAERMVRQCNQRSSTTFNIIRFGNVLGSAGSVVELFRNQIRRGEPVTVTHPDIERYFMTIPEAVNLVMFSATMGQGGETFILDMGKPVKIAQLARQIICLSGLIPDVDVPIKFTGLRPGEKLYEELWTPEEIPEPTVHPGIFLSPGRESLGMDMVDEMECLIRAAEARRMDIFWKSLLKLVPTFQGRTNGEAHLPPEKGVAKGVG